MTTVQRYDRATLKATKTDEGFIVDAPTLSRTGVFLYLDANGKERREYRPPEEVFHADHLKSMRGKPVTNGHPSAGVDAKNVRQHSVGSILTEGRRDGDNLIADIVIHDTAAVESGTRELSLGYRVDVDETPGVTPQGERYDAVQRGMKVNHLAIVPRGRAGNARLNLDAAEIATSDTADDKSANPPANRQPRSDTNVDPTMTDVRLDSGLTYKAAPEVKVAMDALQQKLTAANTRADEAQKQVDAEKARADSEKARADAAEAKAKSEADKVRADAYAAAKARLALEQVASTHKVECKADSTDRAVKEGVIRAIRGDAAPAELSKQSDTYIDVAYDMAVTDAKGRQDAAGEQRRQVNEGDNKQRQDGGDRNQPRKDAVEDAFLGMLNRYKSGAAPAKA